MRITTEYYCHNGEKNYQSGGKLIIKNRKLYFPESKVDKNEKSFYFDQTSMVIACDALSGRYPCKVNNILTDAAYGSGQKEYLVYLNWFQYQKLLWMFKRQWLQKSGNGIQLMLVVLIIVTAITGFHYLARIN